MRSRLHEFNSRVRSHIEAIISTQDTLRSLKTLFSSGDRVWPAEYEDVIECLTQMHAQERKFLTFIERSNHLPLAVVPLRLPLLMALNDVEAQIAKLNRLLVLLRNESWIVLDQPVEHLLDAKQELDILQVQIDDVLDEVRILLDSARFKEREFSIA